MPGQGDIAAAAGPVLVYTQVATFELKVLTFLVCPSDLTDADKQEGKDQ